MSLPTGYKKLEYIKSSSDQYIDTGFKPNQDTRVVVKLSFDVITSGTSSYVFGAGVSSRDWMYELSSGSSKLRFTYGSNEMLATFPSTKPFTIDFNKNVITVDGTAYTMSAATFTGTYSMYIFDTNRGKAYREVPNVTLYSFRIYDNGTLVRDFIPCKNASGTIGLWDDVNSVFYQNAGSGTFTAGPEVVGSNRVLVDAKGYDAKSGTALINGMVYHLKKGRGLLNGMGYDIPFNFNSGTPISDWAVGSTVKISVNGTLREFLIVNQGLPSSAYDSSCNGTWLLMKDAYERQQWNSYGTTYQSSAINTYLNGTFIELLESEIRGAIKQVKIPYYTGNAANQTADMECKLFLLSSREVGWSYTDMSTVTPEGAKLSYFDSGTNGNTKRIALFNSTPCVWWLRGGNSNSIDYAFTVTSYGQGYPEQQSEQFFVRPVFILPSDTLAADDGTIIT